ncbi:hypothetical protein E2562_009535 [Oryza meyeriana var. granulata]|uniref:Uncharacterized protein n=1 Tax=Oryza meyeriana var. granulata TaxID=110450 RepID=A0A6G1F5R8_9ORYZ|nr:hypothetical protein E2562_009535 [Oryza meyeriana var. granulata]
MSFDESGRYTPLARHGSGGASGSGGGANRDGVNLPVVLQQASRESALPLRYPILTRTNYTAWAMRMKFLMKAQGIWEVIEPKDGAATADEAKEETALAIISQAVNDETLMQVVSKDTVAEVWTALRSMHVGADRVKEAKVQTLRWQLENLCMGEEESVDDFSSKITLLVGEMQALGEKVEEKYVIKKLLQAVSDKFVNIVTTIEFFGSMNTMTKEEVIGSLKAYEEKLKLRARTNEQLLLARGQGSSRGRGRGYGDGHRLEWPKDKSKVRATTVKNLSTLHLSALRRKKRKHILPSRTLTMNRRYCDATSLRR